MLDTKKLKDLRCYFGGGTAVALLLDEFRESVDVDFMCSDRTSYRNLRSLIFEKDIDGLFRVPIRKRRDTRADIDGVRNFVDIDDSPVKFEIMREARIELDDSFQVISGVASLSTADLFAEKLLANADRGTDMSTNQRWGHPPFRRLSRHAERRSFCAIDP
ncbi:MAG: nucleotidyl transferase AbiEii/AbiGii toxin family protein [Burkholderiales bacterium]|nr:nucleotidyl transferase AbiEii/AbiGii toxin family protein [Burkholderiales bacterium]